MRIAYVSFEYPPDTAVGGIATYVYQVVKMMKDRGHHVEVFTSSPTRSLSEEFDGILTHRIQTLSRPRFSEEVLPIFKSRHQQDKFDIIESPEFFGDGYHIKKAFPTLPLVVKLHTPDALISQLDRFYLSETTSLFTKLKYIIGGIVKLQRRKIYWSIKHWPKKESDKDYQITAIADQIHTPSISLGDIVSERWGIEREKIINVPYPFIPTQEFLDIPIGSDTKNVAFIGRLEIRKGIVELVKAIPAVLEAVPGSQFIFIGRPVHSIIPGMNMREYIEMKLASYKDRLQFLTVPFSQIPEVLTDTDVCVFPSIWENFPNVCLEAMSAGKAIVASKEGGMKDMLQEPTAGVLIDPLKPQEISDAIIHLLRDRNLREVLGKAAREKVLEAYSNDRIGGMMEKHYNQLLS